MPRTVPGLLSRLLGVPEGAEPAQITRILRRGTPGLRIRAVRELGVRQDREALPLLVSLLTDPVPGVRRSAAWALAVGGAAEHRVLLGEAARRERCDEVRLMMAAAAVRCGEPVAAGWAILEAAAQREVATFYGLRRTADAIGAGTGHCAQRWGLLLDPDGDHRQPDTLTPQPMERLREVALSGLRRDPESRTLLKRLGALQHPHDLPILLSDHTGRRTRHVAVEAIGMHGDPRSIPVLVATLRAIPDPGQGFASRRVASEALGRLGCPEVGRVLERALEQEALEFEGRPGAGLGVQFPVRSVLLVALGESGAVERSALLAGYLSNTHGSALGGFYLPAMDALWKLGDPSAPAALLRSDEDLVVANAIGVLGALGEVQRVRTFLSDPRPRVAAAARAVVSMAG
jgi:HEAT repeat protein